MGLIFPRAAFSKSAIKTLASKWEQGSRSLGCSGTMFRRDGPRFPPGTGLVPEPNFIISAYISLYILVPLAALQNPRCSLVICADSERAFAVQRTYVYGGVSATHLVSWSCGHACGFVVARRLGGHRSHLGGGGRNGNTPDPPLA